MIKNKISIIVPVYNVDKYLKRCIDTLIRQTYRNIEIVIVDDGSTDRSPEICDDYARNDSRIKVIHKENGGLSEARNYGLINSIGDYILYVDSDDYIEIDSCERLLMAMKDNVDIVVGAYNEIRGVSSVIKRHTNILVDEVYDAKDFVMNSIECDEWYAPAWLNLYRKSFLINNNLFYKEGFCFEDMEMLPRLFLNNPKIAYVDYPFYNYVIRENSIMTSKCTQEKKQMIIDIYTNWINLFSKVEDKGYRKLLNGILVKYYIASARQKNISKWQVPGLDFKFALKYSLNIKEKIKTILFNYFSKYYISFSGALKGRQ